MVNRKRIREFWQFRHFGKSYPSKRPGLYFGNCSAIGFDNWAFIPDKEVIEIRDWLSRYINIYHLKSVSPRIPDMKAKSRSIMRGLEKLEAGQ